MELIKSHSILVLSLIVSGAVGAEPAQDATSTEQQAAVTEQQETNITQQAAAIEAEQQAPAAPAATEVPAPGTVARSNFATSIQDHEPADQITTLTSDNGLIYFFTELKDFKGQNVTHRWEYNGEVMADVNFNVGGSRWRVWSSKQLQKKWTGTWKASVISRSGGVISSQEFEYQPVSIANIPAAETAPVADTAPAAAVTPEVADITPAEMLKSESAATE